MLSSPSLFAILTRLQEDRELLYYGGGAAGVTLLLLFVIVVFRRRKVKPPAESGLVEDLAALPPPPKGPPAQVLRVRGLPVRLRLVVVAPAGKAEIGKIDTVLQQVYRGLGEVELADRPRLRVWPPQLSKAGFAPVFFRNARRPTPDGAPSRWVLLAGPARAGTRTVLLGLAAEADEEHDLATIVMDEADWPRELRIEKA
jgi:hypothetical protein